MDPHAGGELELLEEEPRGASGEIVLRVGERGIGAGELDSRWDEIDVELVAEGDRDHESVEIVEAVGAAADDAEIEIDLGGSGLFHCRE